jgi:hypothetical protein
MTATPESKLCNALHSSSPVEHPGRVIAGRFRTGQRVQLRSDRSWIILATRRDLAWQRVRFALTGVALFAAGVATAIIWR